MRLGRTLTRWTRQALVFITLFVGASSSGVGLAPAEASTGVLPAQTTITPAQAAAVLPVAPHSVDPNFRSPVRSIVYARTTNQPKVRNTPAATCPVSGGVCANLTYHGGPVERTTSKNYAIFWQPAGAYMSSQYKTLIERYFSDVGGSSYYNIMTQYSDTGGPIVNSSSLAGATTDTSGYPVPLLAGMTTDTNPYPAGTLRDSDIQTELVNVIQAKGWTVDADSEFYVFTAEGEQSCDSTNTFCAYTDYCGYHSWYWPNGGQQILFANMPYPNFPSNQDCGVGLNPSPPNGDADADAIMTTLAHEHFETVTDPQTPGASGGWYFQDGEHEIGDECDWQFPSYSGGDVTLNGHPYFVQEMWSNASGGCVLSYSGTPSSFTCPPNTAHGIFPTVSGFSPASGPEAGQTVTINGSALAFGNNVSNIYISGTAASSTVPATTVSGTKLTFTMPALPAGSYSLQVQETLGCGTAKSSYKVNAPKITSISPSSGPANSTTSMTIKGTNLSGVKDVQFTTATGVKMASSVGSVTATATSITLTAPTGSGTAKLQLEDQFNTIPAASATDKKFTWNSPKLTSISPKNGAEGATTTVTVKGKNLDQVDQVNFGGKIINKASFTNASATSFQITSDALHGSGTVHVLIHDPVDGYSTAGSLDTFTYKTPKVTSLSPKFGDEAGSTTVTVHGTNLQGVTYVQLGAGGATATATPSASGTTLTFTAPGAPAAVVSVLVSDPVSGVQPANSPSDNFTYKAPVASGLSPSTGATGTNVSISGTALDQVTRVTWAGSSIAFTKSGTTKLSVSAPAGTKTQTATIAVSDGVSTSTVSKVFTYK